MVLELWLVRECRSPVSLLKVRELLLTDVHNGRGALHWGHIEVVTY